MAKANSFVDPNAYIRVISETGRRRFRCSTGSDYTMYFYSLPSDRTEPVVPDAVRVVPASAGVREFYKERDVVWKSVHMRVESNSRAEVQEILRTYHHGSSLPDPDRLGQRH